MDLSDQLFSSFNVLGMLEMGLGGNIQLNEMERLHWNTEKWGPADRHDPVHKMGGDPATQGEVGTVELQPMEIKTFLLSVEWVPK